MAIDDSARLVWIDAFWAAANSNNYIEAGQRLGKAGTTIQRAVIDLEKWLHLVLLTSDVPYELTDDGGRFADVAERIIALVDTDDLHSSISKTRIRNDGVMTVGGVPIKTKGAVEIGRLLVGSRADISSYRSNQTQNSSAINIDMDAFFAEQKAKH